MIEPEAEILQRRFWINARIPKSNGESEELRAILSNLGFEQYLDDKNVFVLKTSDREATITIFKTLMNYAIATDVAVQPHCL